MDIDAISSDSIEDVIYGEERGGEAIEETDSKISSLAEKYITARASRADSSRPRMFLCKDGENRDTSRQGEDSHGECGFDIEMNNQGHKTVIFEAFREYRDEKSKSKTEIGGSIGCDEKGVVTGKVGAHHRW